MARRGNEGTDATEATEATQPSTTETTPAAPAETEAAVDLTAFSGAVAAAVAEVDTSTGTLPEAAYGPVSEAFRALDGVKARNKAKAFLAEKMREAMESMDAPLAKAYMSLQDKGTVSAPSASKPKEPADPTGSYVEKVVALTLARKLVTAPDGLADDWQAKAQALQEQASAQTESYGAYLASTDEAKTEPEGILPVVKAAFKLAAGRAAGGGRSGSTRVGPTRNIATHITEAFSDQPVGTFLKISQIKKFKSSEYGDDSPSAGALSARLFPKGGSMKTPIAGIEPSTNSDGDRGAVKTA